MLNMTADSVNFQQRRYAMAQTKMYSPEIIAQLQRDLCLAYDRQDEATLISLSKQIDAMQILLFQKAEEQALSPES